MRINLYFRLATALAAAFAAAWSGSLAADRTVDTDCADSVVIDSTRYAVPSPWCGHALDSGEWAEPAGLKKLPDDLCYQGLGIYVDSGAAEAFVRMADSAAADSVRLTVQSGYRSPRYQRKIIVKRMREGKSFAEVARYVAPPGYSEHHTGRAMDVVCRGGVKTAFAASVCYPWLKENASRFGFYETYPEHSPDGIPWEPWHWTYHPGSAPDGDAR